jgi:Ankyrin repeats (3 copies)
VARKRKTLPKGFEDLLTAGDFDALRKVYDECRLDAYGGHAKGTGLSFQDCPDELVRWLVARGLDVDTPDMWGRTPLSSKVLRGNGMSVLLELGANVNTKDHSGCTPLHHAIPRNPESVRILLAHGADMTAKNCDGRPPLQAALERCSNSEIHSVAQSARVLLEAGCPVPDNAAEQIIRIGKRFEFIRDRYPRRRPDETALALDDLYDMFGVTPVAPRRLHDGASPIAVAATEWPDQFSELWEYLVPPGGAAPTKQGEVIRRAGRISHELLDNGGINWNRDFRNMRDTLIADLASEKPVATADELTELALGMRRDHFDDRALRRITELSVAWVLANPDPVPRSSVTGDNG